MSNHRTAEEAKQEFIERLGEALGKLFYASGEDSNSLFKSKILTDRTLHNFVTVKKGRDIKTFLLGRRSFR